MPLLGFSLINDGIDWHHGIWVNPLVRFLLLHCPFCCFTSQTLLVSVHKPPGTVEKLSDHIQCLPAAQDCPSKLPHISRVWPCVSKSLVGFMGGVSQVMGGWMCWHACSHISHCHVCLYSINGETNFCMQLHADLPSFPSYQAYLTLIAHEVAVSHVTGGFWPLVTWFPQLVTDNSNLIQVCH